MLWKKESTKPNALYVDIIGMCDFIKLMTINEEGYAKYGFPHIDKAVTVKNDALSLAKRNQGNSLFAQKDWVKSMELYNESLCLAPQRSENIALAYANRSACFLKLKMYAECLVDIDLAKGAGYPTEKMSKLDERKASCLKMMEDCQQQQPNQFIEQLSYEPHENIPSMANVLNVTKDGAGKYSVIANEDIDVGQTVAVEKALFGCVYQHFGLKCNICLKSSTNLIPCKKCTVAMFCSAECQSSRLHAYECGIQAGNNSTGYSGMREMRALLKAINLFPNVDVLMNFVEQTIKSADHLPATMKDEISQYYAYLKLPQCENDLGDELGFSVLPFYQVLMEIPPIKQMFRTKKHKRFLQHLIAHHTFHTPEAGRDLRNEIGQHSQANVIMSYFNQSCSPNMISVPSNGYMTFITARPIKKGEELYDSSKCRIRRCCSEKNCVSDECVCKQCKGIAGKPTQEQYQKIRRDSNFKDIKAIAASSKWATMGEDKLQTSIQKCVIFLKEYGHIEWCNEIEMVMNAYQELARNCYRKILR